MNNIITFGQFEGKSFEWLFFNQPWYAEWIYYNGIHHQEHCMSEEAGSYFEELHTRASLLAGLCQSCKERPLTYMGLSFLHRSGALGHIGFFCDECDYTGGSATGYHPPSFFLPYEGPRCEQLRMTGKIKNYYIPYERLTQKKMEEFFRNDANFVHATPGFFTKKEATV